MVAHYILECREIGGPASPIWKLDFYRQKGQYWNRLCGNGWFMAPYAAKHRFIHNLKKSWLSHLTPPSA